MRIVHMIKKEQFGAIDLMAEITGLDSVDIVFIEIISTGFMPFIVRAVRKMFNSFEVDAITIGQNKIMINRELDLRTKADLGLLCHELTHIVQIRKQGFLKFLKLYTTEYSNVMYEEISFEREALKNQHIFLEEYKIRWSG